MILRRAIARRNTVTADVPADVPVEAPVEIETPEPVAASPAPMPSPAPKTVSVFLSTRKIESIRRELVEVPAPQPIVEEEAQEIAEAVMETVAAAEPRFEIIEGSAPSSNYLEISLPAGFQDRAVLDRAIATSLPFRGLVVSVGVNDIEGRSTRNHDVIQSIGYFIRGLLEQHEFACRSGESEFLIVAPGIEDAAAQQRLSRIAEQLWDYQLRGVSTWSILFSWGGSAVHHERLPEVIAMAEEQMNQTRRGRKTVSVESARPWRKAM